MKIFVSWSGETSHDVAIALKEWLNIVLPSIELWISDELPGGGRWPVALAEKLNEMHSGIVILTKESLTSPWVYFECGALSKTMQQSFVYPYLFDLEQSDFINNPLTQFQARMADKAGTKKLVFELNESTPNKLPGHSLENIFEWSWPALETKFKSIREKARSLNEVIEGKTKFDDLFGKVKDAGSLLENQYLRKVVIKSLKEFADGLNTLTSPEKSYSLPSILYPAYLISLLKTFKPQTKAIAIVDRDETFWPQKQGREILLNTREESTRIFAFRTKAHLREHLSIIQDHARRYDVYVINYDSLPKFYSSTPYDFSIIGDINSTSLLALYDEEESLVKKIKFTAGTSHISRHHDRFAQIRDAAFKVNKKFDAAKAGDQLVDKVFSSAHLTKLSQLEQRHVEMSSYIHPQEYHLHEEKHAYYVEMMDRMIEICEAYPQSGRTSQKRLLALELGAGTGLFTKRLLLMEDIDLTAIELDWACYHILLENMMDIVGMKKGSSERAPDIADADTAHLSIEGRARLRDVFTSEKLNSVVRCINADGRAYSPTGTFAFIFSSFADHHIKPYDKAEYFANIKRNLKEGGVVIVGDEFLPPYEEDNIKSRERALNLYHRHIIEETKNKYGNDAWGLVQLEEAALESGIKGIGDFKLSCEVYERYLSEAGFSYKKELIGPQGREDVGGVYVYVLSL